MKYLDLGQTVITCGNEVFWTILGSCVSIVMFNRRTGYAGICHAQMPKYHSIAKDFDDCFDVADLKTSLDQKLFSYVTYCFNYMLFELNGKGIFNDEIETSLYGGSELFGSSLPLFPIGRQNVSVAKKLIHKNHLAFREAHVGGHYGRKIIFDSASGITQVMLLPNTLRDRK